MEEEDGLEEEDEDEEEEVLYDEEGEGGSEGGATELLPAFEWDEFDDWADGGGDDVYGRDEVRTGGAMVLEVGGGALDVR